MCVALGSTLRRQAETTFNSTAPQLVVTSSAAAGTLGAFLGFADLQGTAIEHRTIELRDGGVCCRRVGHGDECEATGLAGLAIRWDCHLANLTDCGERRFEIRLPGVV